jgi:hypothetical protein
VSPKILLIVVLVLASIAGAVLLLARAPQAPTEAVAATAVSRDTGPAEAATTALSGAQPQAAQAQTPAAPSQSTQQTPSDVAAVSTSTAGPTRQVVATYFHNTVRCVTCRTIEQRARETIESAFAADLASGRLVWRTLNMQKKENEHYATDYNLTSPSLVLALVEGDRVVRFAVLKDTWTLVRKKAEFEAYVVAETLAFLEEL